MAGLWHTMSHEEYINMGNRGTGLARAGQREPGYELASKRLGILQKKKKSGYRHKCNLCALPRCVAPAWVTSLIGEAETCRQPSTGKGRRNACLTARHEPHGPGRRGGGSADDPAHPEPKTHTGERENLTQEPKGALSDLEGRDGVAKENSEGGFSLQQMVRNESSVCK